MKKELVKLIVKARFIWVCGNGGSAATAEHFVTDLVKKGYKAICLNSNTSLITMIANDYGYEAVFSKQLWIYATSEDLLVTISCSGTSKNILYATRAMKRQNIMVYQFETLKDGDEDYGRLENKHLAFAHEVAKEL